MLITIRYNSKNYHDLNLLLGVIITKATLDDYRYVLTTMYFGC